MITVEQIKDMYPCPFCGVPKEVPCYSWRKDGRGLGNQLRNGVIHRARRDQICHEEFIEGHPELATCANLENHRGRHVNADGSLRWSKGAQITHEKLNRILGS